ncbi:cytochrome P450 71A1 [Brachypodium distachyon]|uniref:Cytochrome P450 n=1 Tax=Brachypodium distachyon TaxID=15368 RepID=A0A0Q3ISK6_BRADI|nr:cytochrome P450 71A1 [Brachypodium distachyon]XP_024315451.1 cytochrome P450 71A1 [Brachypodium distachyon]KQK03396.1 hypothetical protein BRADI_2g07590v3 [Brachypodium distachyon]|eukprot:XP_014755069.1 cytochrome P450 71A1 [Brachypodium distachyon]
MAVSPLALVLLVPALVVSLVYLFRRPAPPQDGRQLPPSPGRGLPLIGHLHLLGSLPHRSLRALAEAHGPVMLLRLGRVRAVVVSSAAGAEEVMKARDLAFASRPPSVMAERLLYGRDVAFAPYGEYWRQARRICVVHLLNTRRTLSFRRVREEEAAALVQRVRDASAAAMDACEPLVAYANTVVSRAAFGDDTARGLYRDGDRGRELRKVFDDFVQLLGTAPMEELVPCLGWVDTVRGVDARIRRTFEALDGVLEKVIDDRRRRRQPGSRRKGDDGVDGHKDFVDVLLDVNETDGEAGVRLDTNEIKAIILDMFAAGTDTTSTAIEWAIAELINHPTSMRKLQDEIRAAVGAGAGGVTEDHLDKLRYLDAVLKETLRLHPPAPLLVPRETPNDAEILGYHVPARTRVIINAWAIGHDPATWERAEEFVPERFLLDKAAVDFRGQDFGLVPFGAGRRGCPGVEFAVPTVKMALASLLCHFDWAPAGGRSLDMRETNGIAVRLKSGLPLVATPRLP